MSIGKAYKTNWPARLSLEYDASHMLPTREVDIGRKIKIKIKNRIS